MEIEKHLEKIEEILREGFGLKNDQPATSNETTKQPFLSIVEKDGTKYVRLCVGSYDIIIDMRDAEKEMDWDSAKAYCENKGMRLPDINELFLLFALRNDINAFLVDNGGAAFKEDWYWSGTEGYRSGARLVYFGNGTAFYYNKYSGGVVRPVAAFACGS